jgi:RNA polymerase sigma factor (sigma-70 family)
MNTVMAENESTEALVRRAREGDRVAFASLVERYTDRLECQIGKRLGTKVRQRLTCDDVFQETMATALAGIGHFVWQGEASFYSWIGGIAEHVIRNASRKKSWSSLSLERDVEGCDTSPSRGMRREDRFQRLQEAVRSLKPDLRQAVMLSRIDGLPVMEIARRMKRTPNAVYKLLARALAELRHGFGDTESLSLPDKSFESEDRGHER